MADPLIIFAFPTVALEWRERFLDVFETLTAATREEEGCLGFQLHTHTTDQSRFAVYEVFENQAAFDAHVAAPHTKAFLEFVTQSGTRLEHEPWIPVDFASR
ncbi:putative quinol monooxygenase [Luteibacter sp. ME-Dv--P-043b]|uniref:putative quinol monooxygenase n=1 Tax=Luteibacter sp. ME-Dv--P-043b TaxID=3040291 RepID=UPI0025537A3E|nr:putative quinol monooxygenase [Luteibacter sp. ME-Dv--P-043b]